MLTPYSDDNQSFSDAGHMCAKELVYPLFFKTDALEFQSTSLNLGAKERILDGEMAIDRIVRVVVKNLNAPIEFIFQERFRKIDFEKYQDLTITEFNTKSGQKSELYKLNAGFFLYGYYDLENNKMGNWVIINTPKLLLKVSRQTIKYSVGINPRSMQTFFAFKFDELSKKGCIEFKNPDWFDHNCYNCGLFSNEKKCLYSQSNVKIIPEYCCNFKKSIRHRCHVDLHGECS